MEFTNDQMTLLTLFAGAAISQGTIWLERRWHRKDAVEDRRQGLIDTACERLLVAAAQIHTILQTTEDDMDIPDPIHPITEDIELANVYLPDAALRLEIAHLSCIIWWADRLSVDDTLNAHQIAWRAANRIHSIAGQLLRREPVSTPPDWYEPLAARTREAIGGEPLS